MVEYAKCVLRATRDPAVSARLPRAIGGRGLCSGLLLALVWVFPREEAALQKRLGALAKRTAAS